MASLRVPGAVSIGRSRLAGQHPVDEGGGEPGIGLGRQQSVEGGVEAVALAGDDEPHRLGERRETADGRETGHDDGGRREARLEIGHERPVAVAGQRKERSETNKANKELFIKAEAERTAMEILDDCDPPLMTRTDLTLAVCQQLDPDLEQKEPEQFAQNVRNLTRQFGRLTHGELFQYAAKWGSGRTREIHSFSKPGQGSRVA